jgi:phytoene synthase
MNFPIKIDWAGGIWSERKWARIETQIGRLARQADSEAVAWQIIVRQARAVLRAFSTSFFIVTRFLPPFKRAQVEAIYAAVRYPDEIVDSYPIGADEKLRRLDEWQRFYEMAIAAPSIKESLNAGAPIFLAGFAEVVRRCDIPRAHYRAFLDAMRLDAYPRQFATLEDLIDSYIYGSAIVVGYFLTYVYGARAKQDFSRALNSATSLGIALQLTNFLRDVGEDQRRGRLYLPVDLLRAEGIETVNVEDARQLIALNRVLRRLCAIAAKYYDSARADLSAFAPDCQTAIRACIDVYGRLNDRIGRSPQGVLHRESVPISEKFSVLPASKYWRLPIAYLLDG